MSIIDGDHRSRAQVGTRENITHTRNALLLVGRAILEVLNGETTLRQTAMQSSRGG